MGGQYGNKRAITPEREQEVIELYQREHCARVVADVFGVSDETIRRILKRNGIPRRKPKREKPKAENPNNKPKGIDRQKVGELYQSGVSIQEIANRFGCTYRSVSYHLEKLGLHKRNEGRTLTETIDAIEREYVDGASCYELGDKYGVNPATVSKWMRKRGYHRGKGGGDSSRGGIATAQKTRERMVERFRDNPNVELLEYGHPSKVRCTKCGTEYGWTRDSWKAIEPCPSCRERKSEQTRVDRERKLYERSQQLEAAREWRLSVPRVCKECGDPFWSDRPSASYCCDACRGRAKNRAAEQRRQRRGTARGYRHRMRVTVTSSTYDRTVTLGEVYKKYGGRCCACGCMTYRTKKHAPNRATLDHIVALANNGTHTWDNVQLLCSECNSMKRDVGQMRLPLAV